MDFYIRSQDKKQLLKVRDGIYIANGFTDNTNAYIGIKNVGHVGCYKTEERALEILDEINELKDLSILMNVPYKNAVVEALVAFREKYNSFTYQMPEE